MVVRCAILGPARAPGCRYVHRPQALAYSPTGMKLCNMRIQGFVQATSCGDWAVIAARAMRDVPAYSVGTCSTVGVALATSTARPYRTP